MKFYEKHPDYDNIYIPASTLKLMSSDGVNIYFRNKKGDKTLMRND